MRKLGNAILAAIFVFGVVLLPALHKAHCGPSSAGCAAASSSSDAITASRAAPCADALVGVSARCPCSHGDHAPEPPHDSEHCPLCQIADKPMAVSVPLVLPPSTVDAMPLVKRQVVAPSLRAGHLHPFSRGPPA